MAEDYIRIHSNNSDPTLTAGVYGAKALVVAKKIVAELSSAAATTYNDGGWSKGSTGRDVTITVSGGSSASKASSVGGKPNNNLIIPSASNLPTGHVKRFPAPSLISKKPIHVRTARSPSHSHVTRADPVRACVRACGLTACFHHHLLFGCRWAVFRVRVWY